jgi:excisionase family DNA binding protein
MKAAAPELHALREAADLLRHGGRLFIEPGDPDPLGPWELTGTALRAVQRALAFLADGLAVRVEPYTTVLTTSRAAALLGVTRPTVVRLLDANRLHGEQTARAPGDHRRVSLSEVLRYRQQLIEDASILDDPLELNPHQLEESNAGRGKEL